MRLTNDWLNCGATTGTLGKGTGAVIALDMKGRELKRDQRMYRSRNIGKWRYRDIEIRRGIEKNGDSKDHIMVGLLQTCLYNMRSTYCITVVSRSDPDLTSRTRQMSSVSYIVTRSTTSPSGD